MITSMRMLPMSLTSLQVEMIAQSQRIMALPVVDDFRQHATFGRPCR